jgi:hypothetical protein
VSRTATLTATAALTLGVLAAPAQATFPGQNGLIAYTDPTGHVHTVNPDGTNDRALTQGTDPEWTPDGRYLLVRQGGRLVRLDPDGSNPADLGPIQSGPQISPDRAAIASGDGERIQAGGITLPGDGGFQTLGDWGANGLIVASTWEGGVLAQGTGGTEFRFPVPAGYRQHDVQWAPDSSAVLYAQELDPSNVCFGDPTCPAPREGIMRLGLDGAERVVRPGTAYYPAPSPDGTLIAYGPEPGKIAVMGADGKGTRTIAGGTDPDWQPLPKLPPAEGPDTSPAKTTTVQVPVPGPERVVIRTAEAPAQSCPIPPAKRRFLVLSLRIRRAIGLGATSRVRVDLQSGKATVLRPEQAGLRIVRRVVR